MIAIINGSRMYIKHIDTSFALLVDEDEREHKVMIRDLNCRIPFEAKRVNNKSNK